MGGGGQRDQARKEKGLVDTDKSVVTVGLRGVVEGEEGIKGTVMGKVQ